MLSKKMTFSLMSLITILALFFAVPSAMAVGEFSVTVTGPTAATYTLTGDPPAGAAPVPVDLIVKTGQPIPELTYTARTTADRAADSTDNINLTLFDKDGAVVPPVVEHTIVDLLKTGDPSYAMRTGTMRKLRLTFAANQFPRVARAILTIDALKSTDPTIPLTPAATKANANMSKAVYHTITFSAALPANPDRPQVVSVQRLRPGSQTVVAAFQEAEVTGPFDVRIVLTEKAYKVGKTDAINKDDIEVSGGTVSNFVVGAPFAWFGGRDTDDELHAQTIANQEHTIIPHPIEGKYAHSGEGGLAGVPAGEDTMNVPLPSGTDNMYHQYRVTITPHRRATSVTVSVKTFHDLGSPYRNYYQPEVNVGSTPNGREKLTLKVNIPKFDLEAGYRIYLPHEQGADFPEDGHYILTRNKMGSFINYSKHEGAPTPDRENKAKEQTLAQLKFNVRETTAGTPQDRARTANEPQTELPNLETFLANDGTIHLVSYVRTSDAAPDFGDPTYKMGDAYISEIMWGTDASQNPVSNSNWIEIRRVGDKIDVGAQKWALWFYEAHETPPTAYPASSSYEGHIGEPGEIIDIIGTKASDTGLSWSIAGKGQSGRSGIDLARDEEHVLTPTKPLISMYRDVAADGTISDGTLAASWMQTTGPSVNLAPGRENAIVATPGADPFDTPDDIAAEEKKAEEKVKKTASTGTIPSAGSIYISEIMFDGGGVLPQWIEISNGSRTEDVNLSGWTLTVNNAAADADVSIGASATITIPDETMIYMSGQSDSPSTILVVTEKGRTSMTGPTASGQIIVLDEAGSSTEVDLINAGVLTGKYTLLSSEAFEVILAPPAPAKTNVALLAATATDSEKANAKAADARAAKVRKAATDTVGNLGADGAAAWALPVNTEGGRSSIIRSHIQVARGPAEPEKGTVAENWVLASDTAFADVTHIRAASFYGAANDVGTPGFRPGGALPVELSHFRPARDTATGAVVITWSTQSELNNAGFFVKRSQQRDGEFTIINATMVPGAGTTSEKQFYTYTDTTAQPNVVYYYQIEDVSLDGQRQTLTRGIRLKGHVSVAGKATITWGELKNVR